MDALLGQRERRMRNGHHEDGQLWKLHDGLSGDGAAVFRFGQQLHLRHRLLWGAADALRLELRRHDE
jgi:hypothetical protein